MSGTTNCGALSTQEYGANRLALDREARPKQTPTVAKVVEISRIESAAVPLSESETKPSALVFDWYDSKESAATVARVVGIKPGRLLVETRLPMQVGSVVSAVGLLSTKSGSREIEGRLLVTKCISQSGVFRIPLAFKEVRSGNLCSNHPMKVLGQSSRIGVPVLSKPSGSSTRNEGTRRRREQSGTDADGLGTGMSEAETRNTGVVMLRVCGVRQ